MVILKLWNRHPLYYRQLGFHSEPFLLFFKNYYSLWIPYWVDRIESASVGCKVWWCFNSLLHRQIAVGLPVQEWTQSRIDSCIALTTSKCEHMHSPALEESKKSNYSEHFSSLLSFQKHFYLQSWHCFSQMIWFRAVLLLSTSTAGQCPWETCCVQTLVQALRGSWH